MATPSFDDGVEACQATIRKLAGCVARISSSPDPDALRTTNAEATRLHRDANAALKRLEADAKTAPPSTRRGLLERVAELRTALTKAQQDVQRANDAKAREALVRSSDRSKIAEAAATDRLEAAAGKASQGTAKLQAAQMVLAETSDIGVSVLDTMQQQRESLLRTKAKAEDTNSLTGRARSLMRAMQARAVTNKVLLLLAVFMLLIAIGCVVYFGYIASSKH